MTESKLLPYPEFCHFCHVVLSSRLLCFNVFLVFALWLVGDCHFNISRFQKWFENVLLEIRTTGNQLKCHHFVSRAFDSTEINQRFKLGIIVTNMFTCDHVIVHVFQHHAKNGASGILFRPKLLGIARELFRFADNLPQATAATLHESHTVEQSLDQRFGHSAIRTSPTEHIDSTY